jgi:hypothetical protein
VKKWGEVQNFAEDRERVVEQEGHKDGHRVGIRRKRDWYGVYEYGNQDASTSASENHGYKFVRQRSRLIDLAEHLGSMKKSVSFRGAGCG